MFATTGALALLAVAIAVPLGGFLAVLLFRLDLPAARWFRAFLLLLLFLPLPMMAAGWQAAFRSLGIAAFSSWQRGLLISAWIHALTALPWVVWIVGLALRRVDREREETALLSMSWPNVLLRVTFRECRAVLALVSLGIALQCLGDITVTDLTNTRTLAEEVYLQFSGDRNGLERSVALFLPIVVAFVVLTGRFVRWPRFILSGTSTPPLIFEIGAWRPLLFAVVLGLVISIGGIPLGSLLGRASNGSLRDFTLGFVTVLQVHGLSIAESLCWSGLAALLASSVALALGWLGLSSRRWRRMSFWLAVALWVVPGPVLGFGINLSIQRILDVEDFLLGAGNGFHPLAELLYNTPTPLPVLWAQTARLFPYAAVILWPLMFGMSRERIETARIDGANGFHLFRATAWPHCRRAFFLCLLVGTALALGELSATKIVQMPGRRTFVEELFSQMHYGADVTVARLCILQWMISGMLVVGIGWIGRGSIVAALNYSNPTSPTATG